MSLGEASGFSDIGGTTGSTPAIRAGRTLGQALDRSIEAVIVAAMAVCVTVTLLAVVARYFFGSSLVWSEELSRLSFLWAVFLGAGKLAFRNGHVAVDALVEAVPLGLRNVLGLFSTAVQATTCVVLMVFGWRVVTSVTSVSVTLMWPMWVFYASVPVGAALIMLNKVRAEWRQPTRRKTCVTIAVAGALAYWSLALRGVAPPAWDPGVSVGIGVVLLIVLGVPVAFAILGSAILGYWLSATAPLTAVAHQMELGADSFLLLAIPFFLLAGQLMNEGGITQRLIALASVLVGHVPGGLAHVNVLTNLLMGGMSGSSAGDCAGITKLLVPQMERRGYSRDFSCALTATSSILANLVPPAICMMLFGAVAGLSVPRLFLAGLGPAIVFTAAMMATAQLLSMRRGYKGLERKARAGEMARQARSALWALPMPIVILAGMRMGITTPTEAAAVAVLYALIVGLFVYRELRLTAIPRILLQTGLESAMIMLILAASQPFSWVLTAEEIPQHAARFVASLSTEPAIVLFILNVLLLIVGLPLEANPAIIILAPILMPIVRGIGVDPIHFAIVAILNLMLGSVTPPVGLLVFVSSSVARAEPARVFAQGLPFLFAGLIVLLIVTYVPQVSLFLPDLVMGPGG